MQVRVIGRGVTSVALLVCLGAAPALADPVTGTARKTAQQPQGRQISHQQILERAKSWVGVTYNGHAQHRNRFGSYRSDCSGLISMAWGLPSPGLSTRTLHTVARRLASTSDLKAGDLLLYGGKHAVLFNGWTDREAGTFTFFSHQLPGTKAGLRHGSMRGSVDGQPAWNYTPYRYRGVVGADADPVVGGDGEPTQAPDPVPALAGSANGREMFYTDDRGRLMHVQHVGGRWKAPVDTDVEAVGPVSVAPDGRSVYYASGRTGRVAVATWDAGTHSWKREAVAGQGSAPQVSVAGGRTQVFFTAEDGSLMRTERSGDRWSSPQSLGVKVTGAVSVAGDGRSAFATRADDGRLVELRQRGSSEGVPRWSVAELPAQGTSPVVARVPVIERRGATLTRRPLTVVFFTARDGELQRVVLDRGKWSKARPLDVKVTGPVSIGPGGTSIFFTRADDDSVRQLTWNDSRTEWVERTLPATGQAPVASLLRPSSRPGDTAPRPRTQVFFVDEGGAVSRTEFGQKRWQTPTSTTGQVETR